MSIRFRVMDIFFYIERQPLFWEHMEVLENQSKPMCPMFLLCSKNVKKAFYTEGSSFSKKKLNNCKPP
jgi:hypothetical protein